MLVAIAVTVMAAGILSPRPTVALTFDDLPAAGTKNPNEDNSVTTADIRAMNKAIIAVLKRHHAPAIGFVNERGVSEGPDTAQRRQVLQSWVAAGFDLGNHTYSHMDLSRSSPEAFERDVEMGEASIRPLMRAAGKPLQYFRFPQNHTGDTKEKHEAIARFLAQRGYKLATCTIDNEDFEFEAAYRLSLARGDDETARKLKAAYLAYTSSEIDYYAGLHKQIFGREIPQVMLLHVNRLNSALLEDILAAFEQRGYRFVELADAQSDPAFATPDTFVTAWGPMWGYRWAHVLGVKVDGSKESEPPTWVAQYGH
jgi:peptidoglycan/xylan/chitin deacetylase (PgdA/CDA1 family)